MDDSIIKVTKLVNGDTILSMVERTNGFVLLLDPIQMLTVPAPTGGLRQILVPWMEGAQSSEFSIADHHVIAMSSARTDLVELYEEFINQKKFDSVEQDVPDDVEDSLLNLLDTSNTIH